MSLTLNIEKSAATGIGGHFPNERPRNWALHLEANKAMLNKKLTIFILIFFSALKKSKLI